MIPYYSSTQGKALEEKVENVESKADGCVKSKDGKVHIPYGSAIGGADSAFPGYNYVLKGMYCYAEDQHAHFDDFIPVIMGNNPSTEKLTYSVPIRDAGGRMFTWCSNRTFQTLLDAEVMNYAATKYVIKQELAKTAVLDLVAADIESVQSTMITLTESGRAKVLAFFNAGEGKAMKNIRKIYIEPLNGAKMSINMFNYVEDYTGIFENLQMAVVGDILTGAFVTVLIVPDRTGAVSYVYVNDATYAQVFATGVKFTMTYTDIPE